MGIVAYRASHIGRSQTGHSQNGLQPEFHDGALGIGKVFGQESTVVK